MLDRPDWDTVFMTAAYLFAQRSPDLETKIGAVLIDKDRKLLAEGFNGFPAGCDDALLPNTRPEKYFFIRHAEDNCIDVAGYIPEPERCTLYVTAKPCHECLKRIIHRHIGRVVYGSVKCVSAHNRGDPTYQTNISKLLHGINIELVEYKDTDKILTLLDKTTKYIQDRCL
jgi:deoxycytidylate deaminase